MNVLFCFVYLFCFVFLFCFFVLSFFFFCGCSGSGWWLVVAMLGGCSMGGWMWWSTVLG